MIPSQEVFCGPLIRHNYPIRNQPGFTTEAELVKYLGVWLTDLWIWVSKLEICSQAGRPGAAAQVWHLWVQGGLMPSSSKTFSWSLWSCPGESLFWRTLAEQKPYTEFCKNAYPKGKDVWTLEWLLPLSLPPTSREEESPAADLDWTHKKGCWGEGVSQPRQTGPSFTIM